jgi:hypothetical protein
MPLVQNYNDYSLRPGISGVLQFEFCSTTDVVLVFLCILYYTSR